MTGALLLLTERMRACFINRSLLIVGLIIRGGYMRKTGKRQLCRFRMHAFVTASSLNQPVTFACADEKSRKSLSFKYAGSPYV